MKEFAFLLFLKHNFFKRLKIQGFPSANTHTHKKLQTKTLEETPCLLFQIFWKIAIVALQENFSQFYRTLRKTNKILLLQQGTPTQESCNTN